MNLCLSVAGILHNETPHGASQSFMMDNSMGLSPAQLDPFYTQGYIFKYLNRWVKRGKKLYVWIFVFIFKEIESVVILTFSFDQRNVDS